MDSNDNGVEYGWLNPNFRYTTAERTNILATFKKLGWTPPSEVRTDYNFNKGVKGDE